MKDIGLKYRRERQVEVTIIITKMRSDAKKLQAAQIRSSKNLCYFSDQVKNCGAKYIHDIPSLNNDVNHKTKQKKLIQEFLKAVITI